jgi:hypothetical protein
MLRAPSLHSTERRCVFTVSLLFERTDALSATLRPFA